MENQYIEELTIDAIRGRADLGEDNKREEIANLRSYTKSSIKKKKNTSRQTISSIANTMIGSGCLVLPLLFKGSGMVPSVLIMVFIGLICYKTCDLILKHTREKDEDLTFTIQRLLGMKSYYGYCISSFALLFFCGLIYFILCCNMIYHIVVFAINKNNPESTSYAPLDEITFDKFSLQYTTIGVACFILILSFMKNLQFIVKLGEVGILALISYTVFIIVRAIINISNGTATEHIDEIKAFSPDSNDIINISGSFALAFTVHTLVVPVFKHNEHQEKNSRDLGAAYLIALAVYSTLGILGSFAIVGSAYCPAGKSANTVVDCFDKTDVSVLLIEILFCLHLITVLPLVVFVSKMQFFQIFYETVEAPWYFKTVFNLVFFAVCLLIGIFNVNPSAIIGFTGAFCGFYLVYIIPIFIHLKCIYKEKPKGNDNQGLLHDHDHDHLSHSHHSHQKDHKSVGNINETTDSFCDHDQKISKGVSKNSRYIFYGSFIIVGLILVAVQVYQIIDSLVKK